MKLVTRLRLGVSHLWENKFKHSFQDTLNPLCSCGLDIETTSHYFLNCSLFYTEQSTLLSNINEIDSTILNKSDLVVTRILLYGNESFKDEVNLLILNATIDFVLSTNRFDEPLYLLWIHKCFSFYLYFHGYNLIIVKVLIFTFSYYIVFFWFFLYSWHPCQVPGTVVFMFNV